MGGFGSGRRAGSSKKAIADYCKSLSVDWMKRKGYLELSQPRIISWHVEGSQSRSIRCSPMPGGVVLRYRYTSENGEQEDIKQQVSLEYTSRNYGGERPWFLCSCGRRVGKLFSGGKFFLCRHCYNLAYRSQNESSQDRLLTKAQAIRCQLGGTGSVADPFPPKPANMRFRAYYTLYAKAMELEDRYFSFLSELLDSQKRS